MNSYSVRAASIDDSHSLAALLTALGHNTSDEQVRMNWHDFISTGNLAFVAVTTGGEIVGVITLHCMVVLHRPKPVGRITSLYVKDAFRNRGIGRELVGTAEGELKKRRCGLIEITSNFQLPKAHAFYEQLGYTQTSVRLAKPVLESEG